MNCGIYMISMGDKFYVGSSNRLDKRRNSHLNALKRGGHYNDYMQRVWDKYQKFDWLVLGYCDESEQYKLEQDLIDEFFDDPLCMNLSDCASKPPAYLAGLAVAKKVSVTDPSGEVKDFMSITEAAQHYKVSRHHLTDTLKGRSNLPSKMKGCMVVYEGRVYEYKTNPKCTIRRPITVVDPSGEVMDFESTREVARHYGVDQGTLTHYLKGRKGLPRKLKGFEVRYAVV